MVTVRPLVSRIAVLIAGMPTAGMVLKVPSARPPTCAGPLVGQTASNCGQRMKLLKIFTPWPPSHGTDSTRA